MTLDVGESLIQSWLKHVIGCHIVQTNWKVSKSWPKYAEKEVTKIVALAQREEWLCAKKVGRNSSSVMQQLLGQMECDCLGVTLCEDKPSVTAVEVAFHRDGLHYTPPKSSTIKSAEDFTARKVFTKLFSIALAIYGRLNVKKAAVYFATPKFLASYEEHILSANQKFQNFWKTINNQYHLEFTFELLVEDEFEKRILNTVKKKIKEVSDVSEVFMRSIQLASIFKGNSDSAYEEQDDIEDEILADAHRHGLIKALKLLGANERSVLASKKNLYDACTQLRSKGDIHGNLCLAVREAFRIHHKLEERPTMWSLKRCIKKSLPIPPGGCRIRRK